MNLRGYGPGDPATPDEVLNGFLRALGVPAEAIPTEVQAQAALFRSVLAGRRVLVVPDNANSTDQVRPLLPGTPGCVVVVTSRNSLTGLVITEGAHRMTLDLLTPPEALARVTGILDARLSSAEPDAVGELIRICARLPLDARTGCRGWSVRGFGRAVGRLARPFVVAADRELVAGVLDRLSLPIAAVELGSPSLRHIATVRQVRIEKLAQRACGDADVGRGAQRTAP